MSAVTSFPPEFHPLSQATNKAVLTIAKQYGVKTILVGGYIRDALLGRYSANNLPCDFDYAVLGSPAIAFARELTKRLDGNFVMLDEQLDTCRVVLGGGVQVDLAGCMGGSIQADLRRRDLTINALAWDEEEPDKIIDIVGGLADMTDGRVKVVSEQAFIDDPLRLLRAFRFAASLGFQIEDATMLLIERHFQLLSKVAAERICHELFLILESDRAGALIEAMAKTQLLEVIFPELIECRRVPPNAFHHLGLFDHSVQTLVECERGLALLPDWARATFKEPLAQNISRLAVTKLAGLLHDIGKPATWVVRPDGKHTFIAHDKLGEKLIGATAKRLKWSRPVERLTASLVRLHLRPGALFHQGLPTERAIYRFYRDVGADLPQLILLAQADFRSTCGDGLKEGRQLLEKQLIELLEGYAVFIEGTKQIPRLLDGLAVMSLLAIEQGPAVGELLSELEEAHSLGEVKNREQAEAFVIERYKQKYCK